MPDNTSRSEAQLPGALQDMVLQSQDIGEFLTGLAKLAAGKFSSRGTEVLAAVTLLRPLTKATVASSNEQAQKMDEVQYPFDDGPCLRAAREETTYVVADFRTEKRFGRYAEAIASHGILSALGIPVRLEGEAQAGLDLYAPIAGYFTAEDVAAAETLADEASKSLRLAVRIARLADTGEQLRAAMNSRTVIDVAAGIIMGQNRCSHDTAMTILKAASSGRNIKLNAVAAAVLQSIGQEAPSTHFRG
ncbi:ANTAR domain-containing protein [Paenarthrobacter sp. DKR-5]|uniref:GAF and ANTAR domain-containing protein n=1 Tax=Paenarthrobacter sp. DKR-5 TaxID=2835535 RepID=UPI001BDBF231|nr:GAF and ANTAR domain-containing protein [Paenarthrobacter sp. DKR-5]MBT1004279.1 ANTAR domain-containing protein [Paenarthrobacter sp. DKR-5]